MDLNWDKIKQADVSTYQELIKQFLNAHVDNLTLEPNTPTFDMLIRPAVYFYATIAGEIDALVGAGSLANIAADPESASEAVLDNVASNYGLERIASTSATGYILVRLSALPIEYKTTWSTNVVFSTDTGIEYTLTNNYNILLPTAPEYGHTYQSRIFVIDQTALGVATLWGFIVPIKHSGTGSGYAVETSTTFSVSDTTFSISTAANAIAAIADFSDGIDSESNTKLVSRIQSAYSRPVLDSRLNIKSLLSEEFDAEISVIGAGDPEMARDARNIAATSCGGKVDIYVKPNTTLMRPSITTVQVPINTSDNMAHISLSSSNTLPVYYAVTQVQIGNMVFVPSQYSQEAWNPTGLFTEPTTLPFVTKYDAIFCSYQTKRISIPYTGAATVATLTLLSVSGINNIQNYVNNWYNKSPQADYLVRAYIPIALSITFNVIVKEATMVDSAPDVRAEVDNIKQHLIEQVWSLGFDADEVNVEKMLYGLQYSYIHSIDAPVSLATTMYLPSSTSMGTVVTGLTTSTSKPAYVGSDLYDRIVSAHTSCFYTSTDLISITIVEE